jgi:hypothetical protein
MRTIYLPALGRHVTLAAYLQAVRMAKANPDMTFKTGFTTWWPTTGAEVMIGSGGSRLDNKDAPLPPTEPDWTLSSHPALRTCTSAPLVVLSVPAWRALWHGTQSTMRLRRRAAATCCHSGASFISASLWA